MRFETGLVTAVAFVLLMLIGGYATYISVSIPHPPLWKAAVLWALALCLATSIALVAYQIIKLIEGKSSRR